MSGACLIRLVNIDTPRSAKVFTGVLASQRAFQSLQLNARHSPGPNHTSDERFVDIRSDLSVSTDGCVSIVGRAALLTFLQLYITITQQKGRRRALFRLLLMLRLLLLYSSALLLLCSLTISLECKRRASRSQGSSL